MHVPWVFALLLSLIAVAQCEIVYNAAYYNGAPDCKGDPTVAGNFTDGVCANNTFGSSELFRWGIFTSDAVRLYLFNTNCTTEPQQTYQIRNGVCFQVSVNISFLVTWPALTTVYTYDYDNSACSGSSAPTGSYISDHCYSSLSPAPNGTSFTMRVYNYTSGGFCTWTSAGCPITGESCTPVVNNQCNPASQGGSKFAWNTPTPILVSKFTSSNCTGNATSAVTFYTGECQTTMNGGSALVDVLSDTQSIFYEYRGTDQCNITTLGVNVTNNVCSTTQSGSSLFTWTITPAISTTSTTTTTTATASTTSLSTTAGATTGAASTTSTPTPAPKPDITYFVYEGSGCTGNFVSYSYYNNLCFNITGTSTSEVAVIVDANTCNICNYSQPSCGGEHECFPLPNNKCYNTTNTQWYKLVWDAPPTSSTGSSTTSSPTSTSNPSSTTSQVTGSPSSSSGSVPTTTGSPSSAASSLPFGVSIVLMGVVSLLSIIFASL